MLLHHWGLATTGSQALSVPPGLLMLTSSARSLIVTAAATSRQWPRSTRAVSALQAGAGIGTGMGSGPVPGTGTAEEDMQGLQEVVSRLQDSTQLVSPDMALCTQLKSLAVRCRPHLDQREQVFWDRVEAIETLPASDRKGVLNHMNCILAYLRHRQAQTAQGPAILRVPSPRRLPPWEHRSPHFGAAVDTPLPGSVRPSWPPTQQSQPGQHRQPGQQQPGPVQQAPASGPHPEALVLAQHPVPELAAAYEACSGDYEVYMIDIETNGLRREANLLELAVYAPRGGAAFSTLVQLPRGVWFDTRAFNCHQIPVSDVRDSRLPSDWQAMQEMAGWVQGTCPSDKTPMFVAHNGNRFDFPRLFRHGSQGGTSIIHQDWLCLDTLVLLEQNKDANSKHFHGLTQTAVRESLGIELTGQAHRALTDCRALAAILPRVMQHLGLDTIADCALGKSMGPWVERSGMSHSKQDPVSRHEQGSTYSRRASKASKAAPKAGKAAPKAGKAFQALEHGFERLQLHDDVPQQLASPAEPSQQAQRPSSAADTPQGSASQPRAKAQRSSSSSSSKPGGSLAAADAVQPPEATGNELPEVSPAAVQAAESWKAALQQHRRQGHAIAAPLRSLPFERWKAKLTTLQKAGFSSLWDVLQHYPRDYCQVAAYPWTEEKQRVGVSGTVIWQSIYHGSDTLVVEVVLGNVHLDDGTPLPTGVEVRGKMFRKGRTGGLGALMASMCQEGSNVYMRGKIKDGPLKDPDFASHANCDAEWELNDCTFSNEPSAGPIEPIYAQRQDATPVLLSKFMPLGLEHLESFQEGWGKFRDEDPEQPHPSWHAALTTMHQPQAEDDLERARERLAFDELLMVQIQLLLRRSLIRMPRTQQEVQGIALQNTILLEAGKQALPFQLTKGQEEALQEILADLAGPAPMLRLLQGDVGCGKTVVAFLASLLAHADGYQTAMMCPTEVLAEQHIRNFEAQFAQLPEGQRPKLGQLGRGTKAKDRTVLLEELANGQVHMVIGTHALIQDSVKFQRLGLIVIDEQHKFGVEQRAQLAAKGSPMPHQLTMTATPIPRTLALMEHGDLALTAIDELPKGRLPVTTYLHVNDTDGLEQAHAAMREELSTGGRVFVVCSRIGAGDDENAQYRAAETQREQLEQAHLGEGVKLGLLHGKMKPADKSAALNAFADGSTPVLVSTSVVEVGVDVPEASLMLVLGAEKFGLAQLHQIRGRVGRGSRSSSCHLVCSQPQHQQRLSVLTRESSGFAVAQADLWHRGQGDLMGKRQSGKDMWADLRAARLPEDAALLDEARGKASELVSEFGIDPADWPPDLLAAMSQRCLPELDLYHVPSAWATAPQDDEL